MSILRIFRGLCPLCVLSAVAEVHLLKGDYTKGKKILGWEPTVSFKELVQRMVDADLKYLRT
jgi:GDP-D-mannose dehydratase